MALISKTSSGNSVFEEIAARCMRDWRFISHHPNKGRRTQCPKTKILWIGWSVWSSGFQREFIGHVRRALDPADQGLAGVSADGSEKKGSSKRESPDESFLFLASLVSWRNQLDLLFGTLESSGHDLCTTLSCVFYLSLHRYCIRLLPLHPCLRRGVSSNPFGPITALTRL